MPDIPRSRAWTDPSPHRSGVIERDGVRIHYLDWGGGGPALTLLPGWALTAHVFDEIAAQLCRRWHVVAITPRGFGESDAPERGSYTIDTIVEDTRAVLDALRLGRSALLGHSFAGSAIVRFASRYPRRADRLIFLDAFPNYSALGGDSVEAREPVSAPPFTGEPTVERVREYLSQYRYGTWNDALEADLRAKALGDAADHRRQLTGGYITDQEERPADLGTVRVPALQLCAMPTVESEYPWLRRGSSEHDRATVYVEALLGPFVRRLCDAFRTEVRTATVRELRGSHYSFFTRPDETAQLITSFLEA